MTGSALAARTTPALDDAEAMRAITGGNVGALGALYDRHSAAVLKFLLRRGLPRDVAWDVTQDVFLTVLTIAVRYDGRPSARAFILGIAERHALRRYDRVRRTARALVEYVHLAWRQPEAPDARRMRSDDEDVLNAALSKLSERKRTVFVMVEVMGLSGEETAEALGVPVNTVWTRLHHARVGLAATLRKRGGPDGHRPFRLSP